MIADLGVRSSPRCRHATRCGCVHPNPRGCVNCSRGDGVVVSGHGDDVLEVTGSSSADIGLIAARAGIPLIELTPQQASLEEAFMDITRDAVEYGTPQRPDAELATAGRSTT